MEMPEFLMNMVQRPLVAEAILTHLVEIYRGIYGMFLDAVGPYVQMVEVGDDIGAQNNLLISPKMYRQFIKPAEQALYSLIHEKAPNARLFRHTDGAIFNVIPDLIEVGVDVLNPVQTSAKGMEGERVKAAYGSQIIFHGTVEGVEGDVSVDQVVAEVKHRIDVFAPGGGFVLSSCNSMIDVKPENVLAMFETAREYGKYR